MSREQIGIAEKNLGFARQYTLSLLEDIDDDQWFCQPEGSVTHLAWQVGHLAMAEYALTMLRIRGKEPSDREFMTNDFFRRFQKGTQPDADPSTYPAIESILGTFHAVHARAMEELAAYVDADLQESLPAPVAMFDNKLGSIFFCSNHEMLHAGQIGLLRRLLGKPPVR